MACWRDGFMLTVLGSVIVLWKNSRIQELPARRWNRTPQSLRCLKPFLAHYLSIGNRLLISLTIRCTSRQFRHSGNKTLILLTPIEDNCVLFAVHQPCFPIRQDQLP